MAGESPVYGDLWGGHLVPATIVPPAAALLDQQTIRRAYLWKLTRRDGVVKRFTDHMAALVYESETYTSGGFDVSAHRAEGGLSSHNVALDGMVKAGEIVVADLLSGRYDEAQLDEYVVDWKYPSSGPFRSRRYLIDAVSFDGQRWTGDVSGLGRFLQQPQGRHLADTCWWQLFEAFGVAGTPGCKKDPATYTFTPIAVSIVTDARRKFTCGAGVTGALGANYFGEGKVTWLTGANTGLTSQVSTHVDHATGAYPLELYLETEFNIVVGDTFTLVAGCDRKFATCKSVKFANAVNFGGAEKKPHAGDLLPIGKSKAP